MTLELVRDVLAWCTLINLVVLVVWGVALLAARDWVYAIHGKWFRMSMEQFDAVHYGALAAFKVGWVLFNLVPYLALRIVG